MLRNDGIYQFEYRDGSPDRHYQTLTVSATKVIDAIDGGGGALGSVLSSLGRVRRVRS